MNQPALLMIGGWPEVHDKAVALGARLVVFRDPAAGVPEGTPPRFEVHPIDIRDIDRCVALASNLHFHRGVDAVVSFTEWGLEAAGAIADRLRLRGNPIRPVALTRDKLAMREALRGTAIASIPFRRCARPSDARAFGSAHGYPFILKPSRGAGSAGVSLVERESDLGGAWTTAAIDGDAIAEAYIDGPEFSIDTMSYSGEHEVVALAKKLTTGPPHFVELGHQVPARISEKVTAAAARTVFQLLDLIGQRHGPAHTEFKLLNDQMVIIESQTRTGGDQIWELNRLATGYDAHKATIEYLLWGIRTEHHRWQKGASVRFFSAKPGLISAIDGAEKAAALRGVRRFLLTGSVGSSVVDLTSSASRLGYVVCEGRSVEHAVARAESAHSAVNFHVTEHSAIREIALCRTG
jgi:biotin carboxylase